MSNDTSAFHTTRADFSKCEATSERMEHPLPNMVLPIGGISTHSICGDGFLVAIVEVPEGKVGLIAIAMMGTAGLHMPCSAPTLRSFAANALRTADMLDGGKGKQ